MSVFLSPVGGAGAQFFDNNGNPLSGGKLYTYAAGTTTPQATYTSSTGVTLHTNPIILDAAGRVPGSSEIWLADSQIYKFVLKTSADVLLATWDQITGVNSNFINFTAESEVQTATDGQTVFTLTTMTYQPGAGSLTVYIDGVNQYEGTSYVETNGTTVTFTSGLHVGAEVKFTTAVQTTGNATDASVVSYTAPYTGAVAYTVEDKLAQYVSVKDFGAVGDGVTDDTAAIQAAIDATTGAVFFPSGVYRVSDGTSSVCAVKLKSNISLIGALGAEIKNFSNGIAIGNDNSTSLPDTTISNIYISGLTFTVNTSEAAQDGIHLAHTENVVVDNCTFTGMGRDGIYIGNPSQSVLYSLSKNVTITNCKFSSIGRLGVSGLLCSDVIIDKCVFDDAGIDFEPTAPNGHMERITVKNSNFKNTEFKFYNTKRTTTLKLKYITIENNYFENTTFRLFLATDVNVLYNTFVEVPELNVDRAPRSRFIGNTATTTTYSANTFMYVNSDNYVITDNNISGYDRGFVSSTGAAPYPPDITEVTALNTILSNNAIDTSGGLPIDGFDLANCVIDGNILSGLSPSTKYVLKESRLVSSLRPFRTYLSDSDLAGVVPDGEKLVLTFKLSGAKTEAMANINFVGSDASDSMRGKAYEGVYSFAAGINSTTAGVDNLTALCNQQFRLVDYIAVTDYFNNAVNDYLFYVYITPTGYDIASWSLTVELQGQAELQSVSIV